MQAKKIFLVAPTENDQRGRPRYANQKYQRNRTLRWPFYRTLVFLLEEKTISFFIDRVIVIFYRVAGLSNGGVTCGWCAWCVYTIRSKFISQTNGTIVIITYCSVVGCILGVIGVVYGLRYINSWSMHDNGVLVDSFFLWKHVEVRGKCEGSTKLTDTMGWCIHTISGMENTSMRSILARLGPLDTYRCW